MTADLLSVWTDPDTAMEAVGTSLGIFDAHVSNPRTVLAEQPSLREALFAALLSLVDGGELEKRALADGRFAFRWREDAAATALSTAAESARLDACLGSVRWQSAERIRLDTAPAAPLWERLVVSTAPLVLPAVSCLLAILAFVWLDRLVAVAIAIALVLAGVIGLLRRVPFAGLWTAGLVVAGLLVRLS